MLQTRPTRPSSPNGYRARATNHSCQVLVCEHGCIHVATCVCNPPFLSRHKVARCRRSRSLHMTRPVGTAAPMTHHTAPALLPSNIYSRPSPLHNLCRHSMGHLTPHSAHSRHENQSVNASAIHALRLAIDSTPVGSGSTVTGLRAPALLT